MEGGMYRDSCSLPAYYKRRTFKGISLPSALYQQYLFPLRLQRSSAVGVVLFVLDLPPKIPPGLTQKPCPSMHVQI